MAKFHDCNPFAMVTRAWRDGPPAEKDLPFGTVPCPDLHMVDDEGPGLYLVRGEYKGKRHHSLIAVNAAGELATHGGFEIDERAEAQARQHLVRYIAWMKERGMDDLARNFGIRLQFAAAPLRKRFEA